MIAHYSTVAEAQAAVKTFQQLLGLTHWDVQVQLVEELEDWWGVVHTNNNKRQALIRLLTRAGYEKKSEVDQVLFADFDHERVLIHELLHLHLAPLDPIIENNPLSEQVIENAVHSLSVATKNLLDAARRSSIEISQLSESESE